MIRFTFSLLKPAKNVAQAVFAWKSDSLVRLLPDGSYELQVGVGEKKEFNRRKLVLTARKIISLAKENKLKKLAIQWDALASLGVIKDDQAKAELFATNAEMANFEFVKYKTRPKEGWNFVEEITTYGKYPVAVQEGIRKGQVVGEEVNHCRALANTPGGEMTPRVLARGAKKASRYGVRVRVLGKPEMQKLKMGGILGVARGSSEEPQFIILEYLKGQKTEKPIVFVGKGVTFDTGGVNLKPGDSMLEMHMDMSGGAAVIHTLILAGRLKIKKNIVGLIPAVENMPSGSSYRPGDILRAMSGKTIEVFNTDAEGRIILADALTYAKQYKPRLVVDVATLTGAAMVALGQRASAIFTKNEKLERLFRELGEESGDYVWPLPLWDEYEESIKGTFGDVANASKSRYGGAIEGAMFLYQFAKDFPWVHIDMAPRMTAIEGEYLAKGAAGAPVRLLTKLLEKFGQET